MERLTVSITEDQYQRLEAEADNRGVSKSAVLREWLTTLHNSGEESGEDFTRVVNRLDDLEAEIGKLRGEIGPSRQPEPTEPPAGKAAVAPAPSGEDFTIEGDPSGEDFTTTEESVDEDLAGAVRDYLEVEDLPPKTSHGRGAVVDVFRTLRAEGELATSELQDTVFEDYQDDWSTARTMWNAVDRHLEAVPGIEKAGYGSWRYEGDEAVRAAVGAHSK
jgi:hypothetical protein